jgi:hypothetical protein
MDFVSYAGINSKKKKDEIKEELFKSKYAIELAKVCLKSSLEKYCQNHPNDYMNPENIKKYIEKQAQEMLKFKQKQESEPRKTAFIPKDIHFDYSYLPF